MHDSTLLAYIETVIASSEIAFQEVVAQGGNEDSLTIEFPRVTLFLSGIVVTGTLVSPREYYRRMRKVIESNSSGENSLEPWEEKLIKIYTNIKNPLDIYLVNVRLFYGNRSIDIPQSVFSLSSIQGWSIDTTSSINF
jgi:hypothetical protein